MNIKFIYTVFLKLLPCSRFQYLPMCKGPN